MKFWIPLLACAAAVSCLRKPALDNSETKTTVSMCYKDFFATLEGKKLSETMRAANEERSGQMLSDFGLNRIGNYLEHFYHTKASDGGLGASRWAMFDVFSLYGYAPPWVKWGIPDSLQVTAKKMEKVYNYIQIMNKIEAAPAHYDYPSRGRFSIYYHVLGIEERLGKIIKNRDLIVGLTKDNPDALANPSVSKSILDLDRTIENEFKAIESAISTIKKSPGLWDLVKKLHLEEESHLSRTFPEIAGRVDADEEFLLAVSRFITSPAETLMRGPTNLPFSMANPNVTLIQRADGTPIAFRSYVYLEGTREPIFNSLHDRGISMIVFLDGANGVERQMIFMSNDSGLAAAANKSAASLNLTPQELSMLQKWRPDEPAVASREPLKTMTVLKLDELAPDKYGMQKGIECPICLSDLAGDHSSSGGASFCPNCCKGFHAQCLMTWGKTASKFACPMCRSELNYNILINK